MLKAETGGPGYSAFSFEPSAFTLLALRPRIAPGLPLSIAKDGVTEGLSGSVLRYFPVRHAGRCATKVRGLQARRRLAGARLVAPASLRPFPTERREAVGRFRDRRLYR